jgi:hypothetical protein
MTTKLKTDCKTKGLCHYESATRTNFFNGMLLTDDALRAEQLYHRNALKRLNRYMWGSGIICGFEVVAPEKGLCITVHPGFALDCHGNAIESCKCITIDLADACKKDSDGCAPPPEETIKKCLVVRYAEIEAEPQPVLASDEECGGSSDKPKCQPSKYREGFCLELRDTCPPAQPCVDEQGDADGLLATLWQLSNTRGALEQLYKNRPSDVRAPKCPACDCGCSCEDCAVCLAKLEINCKDNTVTATGGGCRKQIWGPHLFRFFVCGLFARVDKLAASRQIQGVPSADAIDANPLLAAWDLGALALGAVSDVQGYVADLRERVARLEKPQGGKTRTKE